MKRNPVYGFRMSKAFESDEAWYRINRYGAGAMMYWAGLLVIVGIACLFIPSEFVLTVTRASFILVIIPLMQVMLYAKRL